MPAPKKSKQTADDAKVRPPKISFRKARRGRKLGSEPITASAVTRSLAAFTTRQRHDNLTAFLSSTPSGQGAVPGTGEGGAFDSSRDWGVFALHTVALLVPEFDAGEFLVIYRRSLPDDLRTEFQATHADELLRWLCSIGVVRLRKAANSRSHAIYDLVRRTRRPR